MKMTKHLPWEYVQYIPQICMQMMTSSNGSIFRVTGPLCGEYTGEFPSQRPVTWSFDAFFDLRLNKRLSKQWWGWWFETPLRPLWRHCIQFAVLCLDMVISSLSADSSAIYLFIFSVVATLEPAPLFIKQTDVLPHDLAKSRSCEIRI